jgi:hypothetical protein
MLLGRDWGAQVGFRTPSQHDTRDVFVTSNTSGIRCTVVSAMVARVLKLAVTDGETVEIHRR